MVPVGARLRRSLAAWSAWSSGASGRTRGGRAGTRTPRHEPWRRGGDGVAGTVDVHGRRDAVWVVGSRSGGCFRSLTFARQDRGWSVDGTGRFNTSIQLWTALSGFESLPPSHLSISDCKLLNSNGL